MAAPRPYGYAGLSPQCIRVLELYPGPSDTVLACQVVAQRIADKPYEAVSYVWGDPTPVATMKCHDNTHSGEIGVSTNLAAALRVFRLPDCRRRIWVDALCIDQANVVEREAQVRLMGAIYSNAERVLCWLGCFRNPLEEGESTARVAIEFLRRVNRHPDGHLRLAHQHLHFEDDTGNARAAILRPWLAIKELFDLDYFHRAWIIQEVGLARHARLFWGGNNVWVDWYEVATFSSLMDANGASLVNHLKLKSWMANHINLVWTTDAAGDPVYTFAEVLHWARVHKSTDPRDYIYALLSHPSAAVNGGLIIQPNYAASTTRVYTDLAVNVIKQTKSLQILAFVDHSTDPSVEVLPSWVPDWHAVNLVAPLRSPTHAATETSDSITVTQCGARMALKCQGVIVDTLQLMSDMIEPNELTVKSLEKELQKKIPFLIDHIWNKTGALSGIPPVSLEQFLSSLSFVLTGGYRKEGAAATEGSLELLKADFAAFVLEYERIRPRSHPGGFIASLPRKDRSVVEAMAAAGSAAQFIQDMTWNSMCRKVFRTAGGHLGLGPRIMREGDICAVLLGAVYPMILRGYDNYYLLVGPALLYGFMNGEAKELSSRRALLDKDFLII